MTVHHLDAGTMHPLLGGRLAPATMVAHVLVVERAAGLLVVDTGFGRADVADRRRLGRPFLAMTRPELHPEATLHAQIRGLGLDPADVTDVVLTHLDLDHAGGLADFPTARVHVHETELAAALAPRVSERARYVAAQWAHGPQWVTHRAEGEQWLGMAAVTVLDDDVLLVPLHGHTRGHSGVAVRDGDRWLLHAGDAYFHTSEKLDPPAAPVGLRAFQTLLAADDKTRRANQERLREMYASHVADVAVFSAHDATELAAFTT